MFKTLILSLMVLISPVAASARCVEFEAQKQHLQQSYGEQISQVGIVDKNKGTLIIFYNELTGTWTMGIRPTRNPSVICLLASGTSLDFIHTEPNNGPSY